MKHHLLRLALLSMLLAPALWLAGCGAEEANQPAPSPMANPTIPAPEGTFYFRTSDDVSLNGRIFGAGKAALIFSNGFGVTMESWRVIADTLSTRGYLSLLYDYRGLGQSQGANVPQLRGNDLRAAIVVAREHGATKIVLIGSSFGAMLSAKLAKETGAVAVVLASASLKSGGIALSSDDMRALTMPKLLIASQNNGEYASDAQTIYDTSPQPKEIMIYPGKEHGSTLFYLDHKDDAMRRLITFLDQYAPAR